MRKLFIAAAAVLALAALGSAMAANQTVTITRTAFTPADVTVNVGETVTWRNTDTITHQVRFDRGTPCNLTIAAGQSGTCTFRAGGRFNYEDRSQQPRLRGTVTVNGPRSSVTLAGRANATFGAAVTLSGVVSSQATGESVAVNAQECGKTGFTRLGTATTTTGGNWTFTVRPTINTNYQARWRTTDSSALALKVRPAVRLNRVGRRFTARVTAAQSFTGKTLAFQRYRTAVRRWATLRRVTLGASTTPTAGTFVATARFRSRIRRGWRLRVLLTQPQAGTCYLAAPSNTLRVR